MRPMAAGPDGKVPEGARAETDDPSSEGSHDERDATGEDLLATFSDGNMTN